MNKSALLIGSFILVLFGIYLFLDISEDVKQKRCYEEFKELWKSVNHDGYPKEMNSQESFDKNMIGSLANAYYIVCINGDTMDIGNGTQRRIDMYRGELN